MAKPKVLIVDDAEVVHERVRECLGSQIELYTAVTSVGAHVHLQEHPDFALIALDGVFPRRPNGPDLLEGPWLLERIRRQHKFSGTVLATSSSDNTRRDMLRAGCNAECRKDRVSDAIAELLHLKPL
ncbi:MAG: response regulator [Patescibacteria group bacterium]